MTATATLETSIVALETQTATRFGTRIATPIVTQAATPIATQVATPVISVARSNPIVRHVTSSAKV